MKAQPCPFEPGQTIYMRCDAEGEAGTVTGIVRRFGGVMQVLVRWSGEHDEVEHWPDELTSERGFGGSATSE